MKKIIYLLIILFLLGLCFFFFSHNFFMKVTIISPVPDDYQYVPQVREKVEESVYLDESVEFKVFEGEASWYGVAENECMGCSGDRRMANGQVLRDEGKTAACGITSSCRWLKLGDKVKITNLANNMTVEAVITDRGGLREGRILDVTKSVKNSLNMDDLAMVRVEKI